MMSRFDERYIHERLKNKERPFLRPKGFPAKAFDIETLPYQITLPNGENRAVFPRALSFTREWGEKIWMEKTKRLTREERKNCQIVVIPPRYDQNGNGDFTKSFFEDLQDNQIGAYPAILFDRTKYDKFESGLKIGKDIKDQRSVKSVYIVASGTTDDDLNDVRTVAREYKNAGAIEINLIAPFIKDEREDKNVDKSKEDKEGAYNGKIIKINNIMYELAGSGIDRIVTFEPHSAATQSFAILNGMALAPISLEEEMISEEIKSRIWKDRDQWVVVRPDVGRNLVATRIEKQFNLPGVHLEKLRISETRQSETATLTEPERIALQRKNTILYDDEGGTLGTIKDIVLQKFIPADVASINIFLAHARLQDKWIENLDEIIKTSEKAGIPINIYFSDSRVPLGDLKLALEKYSKNIKIISVKEKVKKTIKACINGINFWVNNGYEGVDWEQSILQAVPWFDSRLYQRRFRELLRQEAKRRTIN